MSEATPTYGAPHPSGKPFPAPQEKMLLKWMSDSREILKAIFKQEVDLEVTIKGAPVFAVELIKQCRHDLKAEAHSCKIDSVTIYDKEYLPFGE